MDATAAGRATLSGFERAAISFQATGPVYLAASLLPITTPELAWQGMADLHQRSLGEAINGSSNASDLTPAEAFTAWSNTLAGVLAQVSVVDASAADKLLGSMTDLATFRGGLEGIESPFFSAYLSVGRDGEITPNMEQAADLFNQVGVPQALGGGAQTSPIVDAMSQVVGFPGLGQLGQMPSGQTAEQLLDTVKGLANSGGGSGSGSGPAEQFGAAVIMGGIALATAALLTGPVGIVTSLVVAAIGWFSSLFGGSSEQAQQAAQPANQACKGDSVVINRPVTIINNGGTVIIGPDGQVTSGGSAVPAPAPAPPTSSQPPAGDGAPRPGRGDEPPAPEPEPASCPVGDDNTITSFSLPFWKNDVLMTPSLSALGDGLMALVSTSRADVVRLAGLPTLDLSSRLGDPGVLSSIFAPAIVRGVPGRLDQSAHQLLLRAAAVHQLQAAGIPPETPLGDAVASLLQSRSGQRGR